MQLAFILLAHLVSSVIFPIPGLEQAGKYLSRPLENAFFHSSGIKSEPLKAATIDANTLITKQFVSPLQEHQAIPMDLEQPVQPFAKVVQEGRKRKINQIHTTGADPMDIETPRSLNSVPHSKASQELASMPKLERQESFKTNFNEDFDLQGEVGACHVFATLEVIHGATKGWKLSKEKLFLDHLFSLNGVLQGSIDSILDLNIKEIQRVRKLRGSKRCAETIDWEGGKSRR
jgi:hypothetical protein